MTTGTPQVLHKRRNSATAPYTIPSKYAQHQHFHPMSHAQSHAHSHTHPHTQPHAHAHSRSRSHSYSMEPGAPSLSRDFVVRRISEGETGRLKEELKCEACGKGYKHISSLAKHLWEHTPEWNVTKKLLMSKHQQVQLLEAASILVGMNEPALGSPSANPHPHSRRSLVFSPIDEDQPHSPNSSYTPTPPNIDPKYPQHFVPTSLFTHKDKTSTIEWGKRTGSISQYPPSSGVHDVATAPERLHGGYLDVSNATQRRASAFVQVEQTTTVSHATKSILKSPQLLQNLHEAPPHMLSPSSSIVQSPDDSSPNFI